LQVLVNQSRNSAGEIKGEAIGGEYVRRRAFELYLNRGSKGPPIAFKIIPKAKDHLLGALQRGEGDLAAPGEIMAQGAIRRLSRSRAVIDQMRMVLVSRQAGPRYQSSEQLSGRSLAMSAGSAAGSA